MDVKNLDINITDITGEMATQSGKFFFVAELYIQAMGEYDKLALELDSLYSQLDGEIRAEAVAAGKKITEKAVEMSIKANGLYTAAQNNVIHAKVKRDLLRSLRDAWSMRGDNILRIAMMQRDEKFAAHNDTVTVSGISDALAAS